MRILIAAANSKGGLLLGRHCRQALSALGHDAIIFDFDRRSYLEKAFYRPLNKLWGRTGADLPHLGLKNLIHPYWINQRLMEDCARLKPDLLFVIKGADFFKATLEEIRVRHKTALARWWIDDPNAFERSMDLAPVFDYYFTHDPYSIPRYEETGLKKVFLLPFGCDDQLYRITSLSRREKAAYGCDVCFVGNWLEIREEIIGQLSGLNLKIWGPGWGKRLKGDIRFNNYIKGNRLIETETVKVYNGAKISLNITAWMGQPQTGLNMKAFEITGAGGFLLTDYTLDLPLRFKPGEEVAAFKDVKELKELINYYLQNTAERDRVAKAGYERCRGEHTYQHRMRMFLQSIGA